MKCPNCGAENPSGYDFCIQCGNQLPKANQQGQFQQGLNCRRCGFSNPEGVRKCLNCGADLTMGEGPMSAPQSQYIPRPFGVTVLGILGMLSSLGFIFIGIALLVLPNFLSGIVITSTGTQHSVNVTSTSVSTGAEIIFLIIGVIALVFGIIYFFFYYSFYKGKNWARVLLLVFSIIGLLGSIASILFLGPFVILSFLFNLIVVIYLTRPHVKAFFERNRRVY
ncbi:zinc ribbon domain-containing protein [Caldiplasma sukawensis]